MKDVDIEEPTSLLDHVYLGCTQRDCKLNEKNIEQYTKMFESRISAGATEKLPGWDKPHENFSVVLGHGRTWSKMRGTVMPEQLHKVSHPCLDHQIKKGRIRTCW